MSATEYVSAEWLPPSNGIPARIKAIGDDGMEYIVPDVNTDVPPWPAFLETELGKEFLAKEPPNEQHE